MCKRNPNAIIIGSLGTISYDLKQIAHKHIVTTGGAMGCVMGIGLGYALHSRKKVFVLIGDGSFLMQMGSMSTILKHKPKNLAVIIFDNNSYKSCGGQTTNFKYIKNLVPFKIISV